MPYQFLHGEIFALKGSHGKNSIPRVLAEVERVEGYCPHVIDPRPPVLLYGVPPDQILALVKDRVSRAKDRNGRSFPHTFAAMLGVVVSLPYSPSEVDDELWLSIVSTRFFDSSIEFLKVECGEHAVVSALLHVDEKQIHAHIYVVPELDPDTGLLSIETVWAPSRAQGVVRRAGASHRAANVAFRKAAQELQDRFHAAVGAPSGLERLGPARKRLTRAEHLARRDAAEPDSEIDAEVKRREEAARKDLLREADAKYAQRLAEEEEVWLCAIADAVAATERRADATVAAVRAHAAARLRKARSTAAEVIKELLRLREEVARLRANQRSDPEDRSPQR